MKYLFCMLLIIKIWCVSVQKTKLLIPSQCKLDEFFYSSKLKCASCGVGRIQTDNHLSCQCKSGYMYDGVDVTSGLINCKHCALNQVTSVDGHGCINCAPNPSNSSADKCYPQCNSSEIFGERAKGGNITRVLELECSRCSEGKIPSADKRSCVRCTINDWTSGPCVCPADKKVFVSGYCLPEPEIIKNKPSFYNIEYQDQSIESEYLKENVQLASFLCRKQNNITACQHLANMCVLQMYTCNRVCSEYLKLTKIKLPYDCDNRDENKVTEQPDFAPWLYYFDETPSSILSSKEIPTKYKFTSSVKESRLTFVAAVYSIDGIFVGFKYIRGGDLQLCDDNFDALNKAFDFGTYYAQSCIVKVKKLFDEYKTLFFDLYLEFDDGKDKFLYPVPVLIGDIKYGKKYVNRGSQSDWQLVRRFLLVDNVGSLKTKGQPKVVRYAKSIVIDIKFQSHDESKIEPPLVSIDYGQATIDEYNKDAEVKFEFRVLYYRSRWREEEYIKIAVGVLSAISIILAVIKTWSWSRRSGRDAIDFLTLVKLLVFLCDSLADSFFVIVFFSCLYQFVIFKSQDEALLTLPTVVQEEDMRIFISFMITMKFVQVVHTLICQVTIDLFLIDWEKPQEFTSKNSQNNTESKKTAPVSIWRTFFVANEWNELQTLRRVHVGVQTFSMILFLKLLGLEELTRIEPQSNMRLDDSSQFIPYSQTCRFALAATTYILIAVVQYVWKRFVYERFIEDQLERFVDLCSLSNISIFILSSGRFGYYIHGRAVIGYADTDMREMHEQMKREEEDLCRHRGLLPNTDSQTFQVTVPREIRYQYNRLLHPVTSKNVAASRMQQTSNASRFISADVDRILTSYTMMNKFLASFIDHAIKDVDYTVKDKLLMEYIFDVEFNDVTSKGIFYNDDRCSFSQTLLIGCERTLVTFELLVFCVVDLICQDFIISSIVTFIVAHCLKIFRKIWGKRNIALKTMIDQRFLA